MLHRDALQPTLECANCAQMHCDAGFASTATDKHNSTGTSLYAALQHATVETWICVQAISSVHQLLVRKVASGHSQCDSTEYFPQAQSAMSRCPETGYEHYLYVSGQQIQ